MEYQNRQAAEKQLREIEAAREYIGEAFDVAPEAAKPFLKQAFLAATTTYVDARNQLAAIDAANVAALTEAVYGKKG